MPPRARLRLAASQRLARELEFAGEPALRRIALAAEAASREVSRDGLLSEAWLFERLTGVRSRDAEPAPTLVGQAVAMDLAALALRMSERAPLESRELPGGAMSLAEASRRLGVTARSLQRWKRHGLAMVRVQARGGSRTALSGEAVAWCRGALLPRARVGTRDPARRERLARMGALVAGNDAGYVLTDWPLMDGRWFPEGYGGPGVWATLAHSIPAVQFNHRIGAYVLCACALALVWTCLRSGRAPVTLRRVGLALGLAIFGQAALGVWTLVSATPLSLGLAHQAAAAGVLGLATAFLWTARRA